MLNAEEASARLASLCDPSWMAIAMARVDGLPGELGDLARVFLGPAPERQPPGPFRAYREEQLAAARRLDSLADGERGSVMDALHPGLGPALARWWVDAQRRPYQRRFDRKAFRTAQAPELTVEARGSELSGLVGLAGPLEADPAWLAAWGGHLAAASSSASSASSASSVGWPVSRTIGAVLASAIDLGGSDGEDTLGTLIAVGNGEHPAGIMGHHVIVGLLGSARPEGWDFVERLLLAAQRQEGLRQAILEAADEGHPEAFDRILATVLDHKLLRFAAAVRAAGVWLGFGATVADIPQVEARVRQFAAGRADPGERSRALASADPWDAYLALCAQGTREVLASMPEAQALIGHALPDVRAAAVRYAAATGLASGQRMLADVLDDADIRVASLAAALLGKDGLENAFDGLTRLIPRLPERERSVEGLGVESFPVTVGRAATAIQLVNARGPRPASVLVPWLASMDARGRQLVAGQLKREPELTGELRTVLVELLGDRSSWVRRNAIEALRTTRLLPSEAPAVEALLSRGAADLRQGALMLLTSLPPEAALASASRLAAGADKRQREAAAELRRALGAAGADGGPAAPVEDLRVTLVDAATRTAPRAPRVSGRDRGFGGEFALRIVEALDEIADEHRNVPVVLSSWQGSREVLFGDLGWFPSPFAGASPLADGRGEGEGQGMLLGEVFRDWWRTRPDALRREDGLDALRAWVAAQLAGVPSQFGAVAWWQAGLRELIGDAGLKLRHRAAVRHVTSWLAAECASGAVVEECLDALEATLAAVPPSALAADPAASSYQRDGSWYSFNFDWRRQLSWHPWYMLLGGLLRTRPELFSPDEVGRWFGLMRWVEQPGAGATQLPVDARLLIAAHDTGAASEADVIAAFLHPRNVLFRDLTRRWRGQLETRHPALIAIADTVAGHLIRVERQRGDLPTPTSAAARNIGSTRGALLVVDLLRLLGTTPLARGWSHASDSRAATFSHLIRVSFPASDDTPDTLRDAARSAGLADARLVDLAVYAPQWAPLVERALGWPGLADGVLWLHAHTKDEQWSVDRELRESWAAMTAERTALPAADLVSGAVDVGWFRSCHDVLGGERWGVLHQAAKLASGGNGHRRAQTFAEAMLGLLDEAALIERITARRNQDAVRALGLLPLPLPGSDADRRDAGQRRYGVLREFERGSRKFGSARQASERTAVRIGIDNLARTAGYAHPGRFIWAAEAREAADLAEGPVMVTRGDVTFTLTGEGELAIRRGGRVLRGVPAALRKDEDVAALRARKDALVRQAARVRADLEAAMVAQDTFTDADLAGLGHHPVLAPMLGRLVWVCGQGSAVRRADGGVVSASGEPVAAAGGPWRLAHPVDLLAEGTWVAWQQRLFADGQRQPFKQVFRELYVITAAEREAGPASHRYDGHQLQAKQALALLGRRGWLSSRESGDAARVFHSCGLVARIEFANGFLTPMEADLPTIGGVYFTRRGERLAQPLDSVPAVVFSEAMRDLDLLVSVAHAGGVDPEATASTTQMRAALIRETARLMKLTNVDFAGDHVLIEGALGEYSLHLGSGTVHRRPGGAICIVPVGSQHRGRLFLPFADDDPKTAEIVSKAILLARDHEISDPAILEQLRDR